MVCTPVKVLAASVRAIVAVVVGKVIVVASVPANVIVLLAVSTFPEAVFAPEYEKLQFAAVVGVAIKAVSITTVVDPRITTVFAPDDCTVISPVDRFVIIYDCPTIIEVVGSLTVCPRVPVKY